MPEMSLPSVNGEAVPRCLPPLLPPRDGGRRGYARSGGAGFRVSIAIENVLEGDWAFPRSRNEFIANRSWRTMRFLRSTASGGAGTDRDAHRIRGAVPTVHEFTNRWAHHLNQVVPIERRISESWPLRFFVGEGLRAPVHAMLRRTADRAGGRRPRHHGQSAKTAPAHAPTNSAPFSIWRGHSQQLCADYAKARRVPRARKRATVIGGARIDHY